MLLSAVYIYRGILVPLAILAPFSIALSEIRRLNKPLFFFFIYLIICGLGNAIASALASRKVNNLPILHLYTVLEFIVISFFFAEILESEKFKKIAIIIAILFTAFVIINTFFIQGLYIYDTHSRSLEALIFICYSLYYFKKSLGVPRDLQNHRYVFFYINSALLIYFGGSFFLFLFENLILNKSANTIFWAIHASLELIMYILFTIGLLHVKKPR